MSSWLGWIGSICFAVCGVEEAYKAYLHKRCDIGWWMLITWQIGEMATLLAIIVDAPLTYLLFNYAINLLCISIMIWYKWRSRE